MWERPWLRRSSQARRCCRGDSPAGRLPRGVFLWERPLAANARAPESPGAQRFRNCSRTR
ncbi:hypothetical protein M911_10710 [Ectothiorhodospira haloalkaliphila]|uniref:Uncharacterized protein n=1 Tax=Ectothiorhodospira haloalkaliphila TaxID=421628 RepID=W8L6Q1_9GAMM|nr:hypothetical protein M911_10710 [Ectothiorhodospira haloalkaliphila]